MRMPPGTGVPYGRGATGAAAASAGFMPGTSCGLSSLGAAAALAEDHIGRMLSMGGKDGWPQLIMACVGFCAPVSPPMMIVVPGDPGALGPVRAARKARCVSR